MPRKPDSLSYGSAAILHFALTAAGATALTAALAKYKALRTLRGFAPGQA